jgi:hypothetical protein
LEYGRGTVDNELEEIVSVRRLRSNINHREKKQDLPCRYLIVIRKMSIQNNMYSTEFLCI